MRGFGDFGRRFSDTRLIGEEFVEKRGQFAAADESRRVFADDGGAGQRRRRLEQSADGA